jgi:D-alanyl-D-alanine endopeptidase (penicillin-binding protein 7)
MFHTPNTLRNTLLKPVLLGLVSLLFAAPTISQAADTSASGTRAGAHHHHKAMRISRYGKHRQMMAHHGRRHHTVIEATAPARPDEGPAEITQIADATSPLFLQSRAALVINEENGQVLYGKNSNRTMPIASITKLMTSMVVLDAHLPMDEPITVTEDDVDHYKHTSSRLQVGTTLPRGEMMLVALMASENRAAHALARTYPGGVDAAVVAMNAKSKALGMASTNFLDPTGLHSENQSTPHDLVLMVKAAHQYSDIHQFTTTAEHVIIAANGRPVQYRNTNLLVRSGAEDWDIGLSKTGFINEAGKCLVMQARIRQQPVVIVLMDSWGNLTRIGDANRVKHWLESSITASASNSADTGKVAAGG